MEVISWSHLPRGASDRNTCAFLPVILKAFGVLRTSAIPAE
jgi:hypothetical protein